MLKYTLVSLGNSQRRYSCEECVDIPEEFREEYISLNLVCKRANEEPNNEEIENKRRYKVIIEKLKKELQEKEKTCKVKNRDIKLLQEPNSELQNENKKATVKAKQERDETEHVNEENLRLYQEIEKLESIQYEHKLEDNIKKLKLENKALQDKIQETRKVDNQNKVAIDSNEENRRQIESLKVKNTRIKDNLEQHKEIVTALKEKSKNFEEYNTNVVNQKHQIEETLKITENNLNITKQDL